MDLKSAAAVILSGLDGGAVPLLDGSICQVCGVTLITDGAGLHAIAFVSRHGDRIEVKGGSICAECRVDMIDEIGRGREFQRIARERREARAEEARARARREGEP